MSNKVNDTVNVLSNDLDNVYILNKLTHDDKGIVDEIVFNKLMDDFDQYLLFKGIINTDIKIERAIEVKTNIKFRVSFESTKLKNKFIKMNEDTIITCRNINYTPIVNIVKDKIIDIYFITV